ncbi:MAG: hypothetical protein ACRBDI_05450 [Alphaproteobacteria bacterium]
MKKLFLTAALSAICVFPMLSPASAHNYNYRDKGHYQKHYNQDKFKGPGHHKKANYGHRNVYKQGYHQAIYDYKQAHSPYHRKRLAYFSTRNKSQAYVKGYRNGVKEFSHKKSDDRGRHNNKHHGHDSQKDSLAQILYLLTVQ